MNLTKFARNTHRRRKIATNFSKQINATRWSNRNVSHMTTQKSIRTQRVNNRYKDRLAGNVTGNGRRRRQRRRRRRGGGRRRRLRRRRRRRRGAGQQPQLVDGQVEQRRRRRRRRSLCGQILRKKNFFFKRENGNAGSSQEKKSHLETPLLQLHHATKYPYDHP